jgi:putative ABC transport system substrate-binding protein
MKRRNFIVLAGAAAIWWPQRAHAQRTAKVPRVGVLWHAGSAKEEGANFTELVRGFEELGYVPGRNVILEHRFPNEVPDRFRSMAAELVAAEVDVLVSVGVNAAPYAKNATKTIPVVFVSVPDPIAGGLVKSIARPEANVTGISNSAADIIGKRLEIMKEIIPSLSQTALLINSNAQVAQAYADTAHAASKNLGLSHQTSLWRAPEELDSRFEAMKQAGTQALIIAPDGWAFTHRAAIANLAIAHKIPLSGWSRPLLEAGALMSYGADPDAIYRRAAVYVDKLLKGSKPSELPVQGPTKFQLILNLKTAKAIGLTVPAILVNRADEIVE